ncbi:unnamed protein product [Callosobruchus maculatus]|uniref:Uncharacterized protein n=1 Tax=Callosobruchus maculatus TaxID=64391 RepID=A0A653BYC5_CALMS|nr:unnamed protein product [Callosobruchus maculatus]
MKEYMRTVRLMRVSEETSAYPNTDDERINEDTSVLEGESDSSSTRPSSSPKPPNYSVLKQPDVPLKQATRNAFQATVRLAGLDDIPRKQPEMVNATDGEVTCEEELQENTKSCSKHGKKKCPPPPLSEYTKSAIQGISNLIGMQKEDVEEKVSNESNNDEGETTDTALCAEANATTAEGQPSEEGSSNTASAQSTCGQCRSKCAPPPLAESTRSACRAIGRFVGLGGEEVGDSVTKDENAEGEGEKNESTIAEGQPSGEESSNKASTESTWGQCRSKCSPSPLAESTRSAVSAIGRFIGLGGEEVGNDSVTKDENAEVEKIEANVESAAADCQPKPTSFKTRKVMHNRTMTLNETTNAVFRMFGRMLGATREGVYVPKRKETRGEENAEEIQEEDAETIQSKIDY